MKKFIISYFVNKIIKMNFLKGGEMRKIFLFLTVFLMAISLVLAQGEGNLASSQATGAAQAGQGTGNGTQSNIETQNHGADTNLQNREQIRIQSGNYTNSEGEQMQIERKGELRIRSGDVEANSSLDLIQEQDQNRTSLRVNLSNGRNAEIKIMPNTASATAIARLGLVNCISADGCTIQLKEVGSQNQTKAVYEVDATKNTKVLGLFNAKMSVQAQVDAETGAVVQAKKPWWAFLATQ